MRDFNYTASNDPIGDIEQAETAERRLLLLRLLRGRWHWAVLLAVLLSVAGGFLGFYSQEDEYSTASTIEIKPDYDESPIEVRDITLRERYRNFVSGEKRRLRSQEVIESAMAQPEWIEHLASRPKNLPEMTVSRFSDGLSIEGPGEDDINIYVIFNDNHPGTTAAAVNSLLAAYRDIHKQAHTGKIDDALVMLNDELRRLEKELVITQDQMETVIPADEMLMIKNRLAAKQGEYANMDFKLTEIDLILGPFLRQREQGDAVTIREMMSQDPDMIALLDAKKQLEQDLEFLTDVLGRGPEMQDVVLTRREIQRVDRKIAELETLWLSQDPKDAEARLPDSIVQLKGRRDAIVEKMEELNAQITDMSTRLAAVADYEFKVASIRESIRKAKTDIDDYKKTIPLLQAEDVSRIVIGEPAPTPVSPYNKSKRKQLASIGGIGGFFMGFGLMIAVGLLDRRLRHVSDTAVGMPDTNVLGMLPTLPADLKNPEDAETAAHCVHHIRTLLQIGGSNRVFSITSPAAGSGKSSLATALGMSFAASGVRTLVIDADLVGAGLSRRMGTVVHEPLDAVIRRHGLANEADLARALTQATSQDKPLEQVLLDEHILSQDELDTATRLQRDTSLGLLDACVPGKLRSCVGATDIENFFILPVGKARPSDASRLSPAAMREMVRQAREGFDIVLIDTGPVLGSLEASIVAAESDATVMIVSRGDQKALAARSLEQLRSVRAEVAGLVFNHALDSDLTHTSYASLISQERRPDIASRKRKLDKTRTARLGPLGTAVASFGDDDDPKANGTHGGNGTVNGSALADAYEQAHEQD